MATVYIVHTNGVQHLRTHTSKASAVKVAEAMRESAEGMTGRNIITVTTQARGKEVYRWESPSVPPVVEVEGNVTVQGEYVEAEDAHGHIAEQTAWMTQEGVCVGLCAVGTGCEHCDEQYGPVEPETDAESVSDTQEEKAVEKIETVNVVQAYMGSNGMNHYHAPGCRDIEREAKRHSARKDLGIYEFAFPTVASIIEHEYSDCNNGDAHDMVWHANDTFDGLKIMSCLRDSLPLGEIQGHPLTRVNGRWELGEIPSISPVEFTEEQISTRTAEERYPKGSHVMVKDDKETRTRVGADDGYVVAHGARPFTSAPGTRPWWIPTVVIERGDGSTRTFMVGDVEPYKSLDEFMSESDPGDAGFMETDSVELADWEKEVLEVAETSRSTGITKHSITSDGNQWESFQHVLNAGDIVRVAGMQGVYEVHCLIPGLPTVYVLGTSGEPFPVSATATYAI